MRVPKQAEFIYKDIRTEVIVQVTLHTKDKTISVPYVYSLDIDSNFKDNFTDNITVVVGLPQGEIVYDILDNRNDINMTVLITRGGYTFSKTFLALVDNVSPDAQSNQTKLMSREEHNRTLNKIQFQLMDFTALALRSSKTNGIFKKANVASVINYILSKDALDISSRLSQKPINLVMSNADNGRVYDHIHLPNTTNVLKAIHNLQKMYGVYNGSINVYKPAFDVDNNLYVYAPFKPLTAEATKIVISVNTDNTVIDMPVNHRLDSKTLHIVCKYDAKTDNDIATHYQNPIIKEHHIPASIIGRQDSAKLDPSSLNTRELMKSAAQPITPYGTSSHSENLYDSRSKTLSSNLYPVQYTWENSHHELIKPAMVVDIIEGGNISRGILLASRTFINQKVEMTILTIGIDKTRDSLNTTTITHQTI